MRYTIYIAVIILASAMISSCGKEEVLTPTDIPVRYQLPQGTNGYDTTILRLYEKYRSYFLYKFTPQDFTWSQSVNPSVPTQWFQNRFACDEGDVAYIGQGLDLLTKNWLNYYPDSFLVKQLPFKVLLARNLRTLPANSRVNTVAGFNHITISNFSDTLSRMTTPQKLGFRNAIHAEFFNFIINNNKLDPPAEFWSVTNYAQTGVTSANRYQFGYLELVTAVGDNRQNRDLLDYIRAITSNTKAQLDATILSPATDVNGLIRRKYNFLTNFFRNRYNIDLQAIGNAAFIP